ncbi:MAG: hypothetical protein JWP94_1820 [Mucilaginibacter sp.]|nr:hypothetical protein [Mucilaginibacter sp.]
MKVVLDTNAIFGDFNFKKPTAKILLEELKNGNLDLYIPEVVFEEIVNKFRQRLEKAQKDIESELDTITDFTTEPQKSPLEKDFVDRSVDSYRQRLTELFAKYNVTVMPIPETDHRFLVKKAMLKKKPFNTNEKGYRDNLIWENIKSLISLAEVEIASTPELVFITDNHIDFLSGNKLHEDLVAELEEQGLQSETITIYRNIKDFVDVRLSLYEVQADTFKDRLNNHEFWDFELKSIITDFLDKEYVGHKVGDFEFTAPGDYADDEREVMAYDENFELKNLTVKKLSADEFVVELRINVESELELFVDKSEFYSSRDHGYSVIEPDWNRHVMLVGQTDTVSFDVTLIINSKLECQSIEINKIDEDDAY